MTQSLYENEVTWTFRSKCGSRKSTLAYSVNVMTTKWPPFKPVLSCVSEQVTWMCLECKQ